MTHPERRDMVLVAIRRLCRATTEALQAPPGGYVREDLLFINLLVNDISYAGLRETIDDLRIIGHVQAIGGEPRLVRPTPEAK